MIRKTRFMLLILILVAGFFSCAHKNTVTQVSTIDALLAGVYDGHLACGKLLRFGDTGIGTFDRLDGEMLVMDGIVYQIKADGKVYEPSSEVLTPFAAVVDFAPDKFIGIDRPMSHAEFEQEIDRQCPNKNNFYAIQAHGVFSYMKTRSVPAQEKPYPPLVEVVKEQTVFEMKDVSGEIVGFRCPPYVKGVNVPGYHLHFISDDKQTGGHILDFAVTKGSIEIDTCNQFLMLLPEGDSDFGRVDLSGDSSKELEKVEQDN
jgi:acetolactate decarboxylase